MKRWDYNTLRGEIFLYFLFLSIAVFEVLSVFYLFYWAEPVCMHLSVILDMQGWHVFLAWVTRLFTVFYMYLFGWLFFELVKKTKSSDRTCSFITQILCLWVDNHELNIPTPDYCNIHVLPSAPRIINIVSI